jgi:hypothetical protein
MQFENRPLGKAARLDLEPVITRSESRARGYAESVAHNAELDELAPPDIDAGG